MKLFVFDIGGTEVKYSVIDDSLQLHDPGYFPTPKTADEDIDNAKVLDAEYEAFLNRLAEVYASHADEVQGIAMSLPGFVDIKHGRQCGGGALYYIIRRDIAADLSRKCGCPVVIANDGKCAAVAEQKSGSLKGCENAGVFIIGTGVGGGLIIHGKILNGAHFTAGEYSFVRMNMSGSWAERGNTMGDICSTRGLLDGYRKARGWDADHEVDGRQFFADYDSGVAEAGKVLEEFCFQVAGSIQNLVFLLDLEKVAIGGGISKRHELIDGIRAALGKLHDNSGLVYDPNMPVAEVVPCFYSSEANQIGAYFIFCEEMK